MTSPKRDDEEFASWTPAADSGLRRRPRADSSIPPPPKWRKEADDRIDFDRIVEGLVALPPPPPTPLEVPGRPEAVAPVELAPPPPPARRAPRRGALLAVMVASLAVGVGGTYLALRPSGSGPAVAAPAPGEPAARARPVEAPTADVAAPAAVDEPAVEAPTPAPEELAAAEAPAAPRSAPAGPAREVAAAAPAHDLAAAAPAREVAAAAPARDLAAAAPVTEAPASPRPDPAAPGAAPLERPGIELPAQPSRDDVVAAIRSVVPDMRRCVSGAAGRTAQVRFHFTSSGRVTTAVVAGTFADAAQRSCMARAARRARVPEFANPRLVVTYPVTL